MEKSVANPDWLMEPCEKLERMAAVATPLPRLTPEVPLPLAVSGVGARSTEFSDSTKSARLAL